MRIAVTGARGMLGQAVVDVAEQAGNQVFPYGRLQLDVTDAVAVCEKIRSDQPDVVVNCAAWTDVDLAESQYLDAYLANAEGAGNVAFAAAEVGAPIVHVSTDYVFSGKKATPWVESDALQPVNSYGASKLAGELAVAAKNPCHAIARTAWLFGAGGKNFVDTMLQLGKERSVVQVVDDQVGCPTWVGDLAQALYRLATGLVHSVTKAEKADLVGVYHLAAAGQCSWFEFAQEIFSQAGIDCQVEPVAGEYFDRPAQRPAYSVLRSERVHAPQFPAWQDGLRVYLSEKHSQR